MIILVACSSEGPSVPQPDGATTSDATIDVPAGDSRLPGCSMNSECDDGVSCTEDRCIERVCRHLPNAARCGAAQTCDDRRGCVAGRACGTSADCADMDPCTVRERCDPSARVCVSERLDGDSDGEPPRSCGGNDCDDDNPRRRPGLPETCDSADNDCNGMVDDSVSDCTMPGSVCSSIGRCECPVDRCATTEGTFICVDRQTDRNNCGFCGQRCPAGVDCVMGRCPCPAERPFCATSRPTDCFDPAMHQSDSLNCGACGTRCPEGAACQAGRCVCTTPGHALCGDRCENTLTSNSNCGGCGVRCAFESTCQMGRCVCTFPGRTICGDSCVNTQEHPGHCGGCGRACSSTMNCVGGRCGCFDVRVNTFCAGGCTDAQRDPMNCGSCGRVCSAPEGVSGRRVCSEGQCVCLYRSAAGLAPMYFCPSAMGTDSCVDVLIDTRNCGRCGNACRAGESCIHGSCLCPDTRCGDRCGVNLMTDNNNCGACGNICATGTVCQSGRCAAACPMFCSDVADCAPCTPFPGYRSCCVSGWCVSRAMCP